MILIPAIATACIGMLVGNALRGCRIEDVDHTNLKVTIISTLPVLALIGVSVVTPIVTGAFFGIGCALELLALVVYVFAVAAFVKARRGVTAVGIYRLSRNPMYASQFLLFAGFVFMAWSASAMTGLLAAVSAAGNAAVTHWMVLGEEKFLARKYGEEYIAYRNKVPRYFGFRRQEQPGGEDSRRI